MTVPERSCGTLLLVAARLYFFGRDAPRIGRFSRRRRREARPPRKHRRPCFGRARSKPHPAATAKTRDEKRFGRADKDDDGRITRA